MPINADRIIYAKDLFYEALLLPDATQLKLILEAHDEFQLTDPKDEAWFETFGMRKDVFKELVAGIRRMSGAAEPSPSKYQDHDVRDLYSTVLTMPTAKNLRTLLPAAQKLLDEHRDEATFSALGTSRYTFNEFARGMKRLMCVELPPSPPPLPAAKEEAVLSLSTGP